METYLSDQMALYGYSVLLTQIVLATNTFTDTKDLESNGSSSQDWGLESQQLIIPVGLLLTQLVPFSLALIHE